MTSSYGSIAERPACYPDLRGQVAIVTAALNKFLDQSKYSTGGLWEDEIVSSIADDPSFSGWIYSQARNMKARGLSTEDIIRHLEDTAWNAVTSNEMFIAEQAKHKGGTFNQFGGSIWGTGDKMKKKVREMVTNIIAAGG